MFELIEKNFILFVFVLFGAMAAMAVYIHDRARVVAYDCSIAEISPDIPPDVREACRKLRAGK